MPAAAVFGFAGERLSRSERAFFRDADPWGFILFARNVPRPRPARGAGRRPAQLGGAERARPRGSGGGRVARLRGPHWTEWEPPAEVALGADDDGDPVTRRFAARYDRIARELREVGVDVNCAPVVDVPQPGAHEVIGDRALGADPQQIAERGRAACEAMLARGVLPVLKHAPGHGRARADSHFELPVVTVPREDLERVDFAPFRALVDMPIAMTAHVLYEAIDPQDPATSSEAVLQGVLRDEIGFEGALISDDLGMQALSGSGRDRARRALQAGCDIVLHCNGELTAMVEVMSGVSTLVGEAARRASAAEARRVGLGNA